MGYANRGIGFIVGWSPFFLGLSNSQMVDSLRPVYHYSNRTMVYGAEMGYCIPHFDEIVQGFKVLDKENPYDNGFDVTDTNEVIIADKSDDYIELHLIKRFDGEEYIIKVQRITNE